MPETHPTPDPTPNRPRLRRQSPIMRKLRTKKTRTTRARNVLPRLLTKIQDMWLMDLREPPKESHVGSRHEHRASRISSLSPQARILAKDIIQAEAPHSRVPVKGSRRF